MQHAYTRAEPASRVVVQHSRPMRRVGDGLVVAASLTCAASMLGLGIWAFVAPQSFSAFINFPPYNEHLIHDAGVFQIGIGVAALLAIVWRDALLVGLTGFASASAMHAVSHMMDRPLGGHDSDVPLLAVITLVGLFGIWGRLRWRNA